MGLSCYCDEDGDNCYEAAGSYDHAKHGNCKCEACGDVLGAGDDGTRFLLSEQVSSDKFPPMPPSEPQWLGPEPECSDLYRHWCQALDAAEQEYHDWVDATGWDDERDCHMQTTAAYLCERCSGLYEALHVDLGYCSVSPWSLIDDHQEYVFETTGKWPQWVRDANGVLQPERRAA